MPLCNNYYTAISFVKLTVFMFVRGMQLLVTGYVECDLMCMRVAQKFKFIIRLAYKLLPEFIRP